MKKLYTCKKTKFTVYKQNDNWIVCDKKLNPLITVFDVNNDTDPKQWFEQQIKEKAENAKQQIEIAQKAATEVYNNEMQWINLEENLTKRYLVTATDSDGDLLFYKNVDAMNKQDAIRKAFVKANISKDQYTIESNTVTITDGKYKNAVVTVKRDAFCKANV